MQAVSGRRALRNNPFAAAGGRKAMLAAVTLGLVAAMLSWSYVQRAGVNAAPVGTVPVVVAAVDIPVRTQITAGMLVVKQIAPDARHPKALSAAEQLDGKVTNLPITAGEQVLSTKFFARKEDSGLAFRIPPGSRAVSVAISEVISSGGMIVPGDHVDVMALFSAGVLGDSASAQGSQAGQDSAAIVLQNIEVLAVAQELQGVIAEPQGTAAGIGSKLSGNSSRPDTQRQEAVARPNARTVTMAVTPEQAQKLILAEEKGKIRLALRAVEDTQPVQIGPTLLKDVAK